MNFGPPHHFSALLLKFGQPPASLLIKPSLTSPLTLPIPSAGHKSQGARFTAPAETVPTVGVQRLGPASDALRVKRSAKA